MPEYRHAYKTVALSGLIPWERNAMTHPEQQVEQLRASIRAFGFTNPILIDPELRIIAGHGRVMAARAEGYEHVPAIELQGLTQAQKRALVLADNQLARNATWDEELLKLELGALGSDGFDLSVVGFSSEDLDRLTGHNPPSTKDPDAAPPAPKRPASRTGDLWQMGPHRVLCGDSFEPEDVKRLTGGKLVNMVLTDPPYAIYGSSSGIGTDIADDKMVRPFFEKLGQVIIDNLKEFGHAYVHCDWRSYATLWHGLKFARLSPKNCIVWDKGHFGLGGMYGNTHEFVAFFARLPPPKAMTSNEKSGQRSVLGRANIFRCNRVAGPERQHNAAKPVELLGWLIEASSDTGDTVLDLFAGSGSTMIAAEQKKRAAWLMEMEPRHVDVCIERWQTFAGSLAVLEGDGRTFAEVKEERHGSRKGPAATRAN